LCLLKKDICASFFLGYLCFFGLIFVISL
jgi:hypothetical protein